MAREQLQHVQVLSNSPLSTYQDFPESLLLFLPTLWLFLHPKGFCQLLPALSKNKKVRRVKHLK
jgi:hypothetical protein